MTNTPDDDLTKVHLDLPNHWWFKGESLWAKDLGGDLYEIQNVPFCAYGLNCKDVVFATADAPDLKPEVRSVVRRSGCRTLRLFFMQEPPDKQAQQPYLDELSTMDAWVERANARVVCVNVNPTADYDAICQHLTQLEASEVLEYETCEERIPGSFDDAPEQDEP
jgi:Domain of unknown function (DUF4265)